MLFWIEKWNGMINDFVWGPGMIALFLFTGIYLTVKSGWFQVRGAKIWWRHTAGQLLVRQGKSDTDQHSMTQFQSFCTAMAATLGIGNITGVAAALVTGGPGAIFWMWVSAFFGMMTAYAENILGIRYRKKDGEGNWHGGAMCYIEQGLGCRWLAVVYAFCCVMVSFGMGNMTQANAVAVEMREVFGISEILTMFVLLIAILGVLSGGIKRIGRICEWIVPIMAIFYLMGGMLVIVCNIQNLPEAFSSIIRYAFTPAAACGGAVGYSMKQAVKTGIARGIFSNEAGLGTSVMAHTASDVKNPQIQGMWAIFEVFIDTMLICSVTALVIMTSGVYDPNRPGDTAAVTMAGQAFSTVFPWGDAFLAIATVFFAFATIIGWYYFGKQAIQYLFRKRGECIYRIIYLMCICPGCVLGSGLIWELADTMNGLMAIPNLAALLLLNREITFHQ